MAKRNGSVADVLATQGLIAVLFGLLVLVLHWAEPEYGQALQTEWMRCMEESPTVSAVWQTLQDKWFG